MAYVYHYSILLSGFTAQRKILCALPLYAPLSSNLHILFFFKDFIYLFMKDKEREREREAETQEEGEGGSMQGA